MNGMVECHAGFVFILPITYCSISEGGRRGFCISAVGVVVLNCRGCEKPMSGFWFFTFRLLFCCRAFVFLYTVEG